MILTRICFRRNTETDCDRITDAVCKRTPTSLNKRRPGFDGKRFNIIKARDAHRDEAARVQKEELLQSTVEFIQSNRHLFEE